MTGGGGGEENGDGDNDNVKECEVYMQFVHFIVKENLFNSKMQTKIMPRMGHPDDTFICQTYVSPFISALQNIYIFSF